jgi:WD40 repeat protein
MIHSTKQVVSGSADATIKIWNLSDGSVERTLYGHTDWVYSLEAFENENGTRIASGSWDKSKLWVP